MASERVQRQIDRLLDQAEEAVGQKSWALVRENAQAVIDLDPDNGDARTFLAAAERALSRDVVGQQLGAHGSGQAASADFQPAPVAHPASFCDGRYQVKRFLKRGRQKAGLPGPRHQARPGGGLCPHQDRRAR